MKNIFKKKVHILDTSNYSIGTRSLIPIKHIRKVSFNEEELFTDIYTASNQISLIVSNNKEPFEWLKEDLTKVLKNYYGEE